MQQSLDGISDGRRYFTREVQFYQLKCTSIVRFNVLRMNQSKRAMFVAFCDGFSNGFSRLFVLLMDC